MRCLRCGHPLQWSLVGGDNLLFDHLGYLFCPLVEWEYQPHTMGPTREQLIELAVIVSGE